MSLKTQTRRGFSVDVARTLPRSPEFYYKLPLPKVTSFKSTGHESNLKERLRLGHTIPNPKKFSIDHDRVELLSKQDHGIKIQLSNKTLDQLGQQQNNIIKEIKQVIDKATVPQLQGLSRDVGLPIVDSITDLKVNLIHDLSIVFKDGIDANSRQQRAILATLGNIEANQFEIIDQLRHVLAAASVDELREVALNINTPVVDSVNDLRANLDHDIDSIFKGDDEAKKQQVVEAITDLDPSVADELREIIERGKQRAAELRGEIDEDEDDDEDDDDIDEGKHDDPPPPPLPTSLPPTLPVTLLPRTRPLIQRTRTLPKKPPPPLPQFPPPTVSSAGTQTPGSDILGSNTMKEIVKNISKNVLVNALSRRTTKHTLEDVRKMTRHQIAVILQKEHGLSNSAIKNLGRDILNLI
jgi:hypothetical protein